MGSKPSKGRGRKTGKPAARARAAVKLDWAIASDYGAARKVQKTIMQSVRAARFDEHSVFAINLSLEEAMINAIKHGNGLDKELKVQVECTVSPKQVEIVIEDQGKGFSRKDVPDPTLAENLCKTCGRGILLIEAYMDQVQYSRGGRRVRMIKKNERDGQDARDEGTAK